MVPWAVRGEVAVAAAVRLVASALPSKLLGAKSLTYWMVRAMRARRSSKPC